MRTCWRAIRYFKAERRLIALLIALIAVAFGISVLQAQPISILVDTVFNGIDRTDFFAKLFAAVLPTSAAGKIVGIGVLILLLKIITDVNNLLLRGMINNAIRYRGLARIRLALYKKLQDLPISFHKSWPQGDLLYRLTTDTQGFFGLLDTVIGAAVACVTLAVLTWLMFERSVPLAIVALSIVPPLLVANWYFTRQIRPRVTNAKQLEADMTTVMQRSLGSIGLIQAFCRQFLHFGHMTKAVRNSNDSYWKLNWTESSYALAVQTLVGLGASAFWIYGGLLAYHDQFVVKNPDGVTFGKIIEFSAYLRRTLLLPIGSLRFSTSTTPWMNRPRPRRCR
jgi:ABC-type multidrug transport system fused ATPase/permease subunit